MHQFMWFKYFIFFSLTLISANKRVIYRYTDGNSVPNKTAIGLTVDRCGYVYSAVFNGGEVLKICPRQVNFYEKYKCLTEDFVLFSF